MLIVKSVEEGSIAEEFCIEPGDKILKICGKETNDTLEFLRFEAKRRVKLLIEKKNGEREVLSCVKDEMEGLGVEIEDNFCIRECCNNCIFCFINQLPKGMRNSLYVKDDDFRMSFSNGNYVTLSNASKADIKRIIDLRLSPLYVSVHAVTTRIRQSMLGNMQSGDVLKMLKKLSKHIVLHAQIVMVPGFNDGKELEKTISKIAPYVGSIAVVPVGLTKHRKGLPKLKDVDKECASKTIDAIEKFQKEFFAKYGTRKVFAADEFYIVAERELPEAQEYEDFSQIENGIGLLPKFEEEFYTALLACKPSTKVRTVSIATGKSAYPFIKKMSEDLHEKFKNVKVLVSAIENDFFGHSVTTAGLLTGQDILAQMKGKQLGEELLISGTMLREGTDKFLDDMTTKELAEKLGTKIVPVDNTGEAFLNAILGEKQ